MNCSLSELVDNLSEPSKNLSNNVLQERIYNAYQLCSDNIEKLKLI